MSEKRYVLLRPSKHDDIAFAVSGDLAGDGAMEAGLQSQQKTEAETYLDRLCDVARQAKAVPPADESLDPIEQRKANALSMLGYLDSRGAFTNEETYESMAQEFAHGIATALFYALSVEDQECLVIDLQEQIVGVLEERPW